MRILLAITDSVSSAAAVDEVRQRDWPAGTTVRVLHLLEKFVPSAQQLWYDAGGSLDKAKNEIREHYSELAQNIATQLQQAGLVVEMIVRDGNPRTQIVTVARDWGAGLIVIGTHHHWTIAGLFKGSVAQAVMNSAQCPVEIVPAQYSKGELK